MLATNKAGRTKPTLREHRVAQIVALLGATDNDPFLSLAQAARRAKIPLSSLSQAVTDGRVHALIMPDQRRYVAWSDVEQFVQRTRNGYVVKPHILLRLAALSNRPDTKDLPVDFSTNHDRTIPDTSAE